MTRGHPAGGPFPRATVASVGSAVTGFQTWICGPNADKGCRERSRHPQKPLLPAVALAGLAALAIILRLVPVIFVPSQAWPDEIFQATEQAHRLVYGTGLVPWEFQLGIRSWLLPGIITGLMEAARLAGDGPDYYLPVIAGAFALLATIPIICCFLWACRLFGRTGGLVAAAVVATAPELVYFGARTLCEVVAAHLLIGAIYALDPGTAAASRRRCFAGGALLGLVCVLRIQLAPALILVALWTAWRCPRERLLAMLAGAFVIVCAAGLLDTLTLGYPLASIWRYVLYNSVYGASANFGIEPWYYYFVGEFGVWSFAFGPLLFLILLGARRLPLLFAAAIIIIAVHSGIPHKEYRFIYPAIVCLMVLAGVGLAQIVAVAEGWLSEVMGNGKIAPWACAGLAVASWCLISLAIWTGPTLTALRNRRHDYLLAVSFVAHGPAPCGVGLYGLDGTDWQASDGYTLFDRPAPLYWPKDPRALTSAAAAFDALISVGPVPGGLGFTMLKCFGPVCVARRTGACRPMAPMPMPFPASLAGLADTKPASIESRRQLTAAVP